jgi:3-oxoacyl-[acyl-carrier protein] reductase
MGDKSEQVVFITGSASGVGLQLTKRFIAEGYRVIATDINLDALQRLASSEDWAPEQVWVRGLDIRQGRQWKSLWNEVLSGWEKVDILFNVAGYLLPGYVADLEFEQIDRHFDINVKGLMYGSQLAAEHMAGRGAGHIVNIASLAGLAPVPGLSLYSASKFAVRGFTLAMAQELKPRGVSVTVICPDAIETPMLDLQEDYEEAALTFSGGHTLTVTDIEHAVFERVLPKKPIELAIPESRAWLAKLGSAVPSGAHMLSSYLGKLGRKKQKLRKGSSTLY